MRDSSGASQTSQPGQHSQYSQRLLVFGAHPDDAEFHCGALMLKHAAAGHGIHLISATDGSAGHQQLGRQELAKRRLEEARDSAQILGAQVEVWPFKDGELLPSLELRLEIIGALSRIRPHLVITPRLYDYHPDHRALAQAVQDACYLVRVPNVLPHIPALDRDPVVAYCGDLFDRPVPLRADVVLDCSARLNDIADLLACHASQVFEWLPYTLGLLDEVPVEPARRQAWLKQFFSRRTRALAHRFAPHLSHAEVYEISEYGQQPSAETCSTLFCHAVTPDLQ